MRATTKDSRLLSTRLDLSDSVGTVGDDRRSPRAPSPLSRVEAHSRLNEFARMPLSPGLKFYGLDSHCGPAESASNWRGSTQGAGQICRNSEHEPSRWKARSKPEAEEINATEESNFDLKAVLIEEMRSIGSILHDYESHRVAMFDICDEVKSCLRDVSVQLVDFRKQTFNDIAALKQLLCECMSNGDMANKHDQTLKPVSLKSIEDVVRRARHPIVACLEESKTSLKTIEEILLYKIDGHDCPSCNLLRAQIAKLDHDTDLKVKQIGELQAQLNGKSPSHLHFSHEQPRHFPLSQGQRMSSARRTISFHLPLSHGTLSPASGSARLEEAIKKELISLGIPEQCIKIETAFDDDHNVTGNILFNAQLDQ